MDIGVSSNFERYLFYLFGSNPAKLSEAMNGFKSTGKLHASSEELRRAQQDFVSAAASEQQQMDTMRYYEKNFDYIMCPHTACGMSAVDQLRTSLNWAAVPNHSMVVLGTAHPGKFMDAVAEAISKPVILPPGLARVQNAETRFQVLQNSADEIRLAIQRNTQAKAGGCVSCITGVRKLFGLA